MTRRRHRVFRDPHYWFSVEVQMHCALGDHACGRGTRMRGRRGDVFRRFSCADCLRRQYGVTEPQRSFTFRSEAPYDVRARRSGED